MHSSWFPPLLGYRAKAYRSESSRPTDARSQAVRACPAIPARRERRSGGGWQGGGRELWRSHCRGRPGSPRQSRGDPGSPRNRAAIRGPREIARRSGVPAKSRGDPGSPRNRAAILWGGFVGWFCGVVVLWGGFVGWRQRGQVLIRAPRNRAWDCGTRPSGLVHPWCRPTSMARPVMGRPATLAALCGGPCCNGAWDSAT
jgi:hypothetical protein